VVLQDPVEGGVGAEDHDSGAGRERDQLGAGGGTLELAARGECGRSARDDAVDVCAVTADGDGAAYESGALGTTSFDKGYGLVDVVAAAQAVR